jgi:hypothetical protein
MTNRQIPTRVRFGLASRRIALGGLWLFLAISGCSNPRAPEQPASNNPPPANAQRGGQSEVESVRLITPHKVGQRYRTTRTLRVEEKTETDNLVITS